jgi:hypothetical protein
VLVTLIGSKHETHKALVIIFLSNGAMSERAFLRASRVFSSQYLMGGSFEDKGVLLAGKLFAMLNPSKTLLGLRNERYVFRAIGKLSIQVQV